MTDTTDEAARAVIAAAEGDEGDELDATSTDIAVLRRIIAQQDAMLSKLVRDGAQVPRASGQRRQPATTAKQELDFTKKEDRLVGLAAAMRSNKTKGGWR